MNGTPANLTVWICDFSFNKPARKEKIPGSAAKEIDKVMNRIIISTSDPSGDDCYRVARRLVLGEFPYEGSDFRMLSCQRMVEVMGVVGVTTWDKLDGKAPLTPGVAVVAEEDPEDDDKEGGSVPPNAALN